MVLNKGTKVPFPLNHDDASYAKAISEALICDVGATARSAKTIMKWANVSNRTARNWLSADKAPGGLNLLLLARHSPSVWEVVLSISSHEEALLVNDLHAAEVALSRALGHLERLKRGFDRSRIQANNSKDGNLNRASVFTGKKEGKL
tara:strand:+ start:11294 stop:11737 length:444 start_codon:yes stop_codon:yes gene_type:complete